MPTVCELQIEAKKRGLRGYSKLKKSELEALLNKKASSPPKTIKVKKSKLDAIRKKKAPTPAKTEKEVMDMFEKSRRYNDLLNDVMGNELEALAGGKRLTEKQQNKLLDRASASAFRIVAKSAKDFLKKKDWKKMGDDELIKKMTAYISQEYF